jgi:hypothetical protein
MMQISDKWKAVVAAIGVLGSTLSFAVKDGNVSLQEAGGIAIAAAAVGAAVWAVKNR